MDSYGNMGGTGNKILHWMGCGGHPARRLKPSNLKEPSATEAKSFLGAQSIFYLTADEYANPC